MPNPREKGAPQRRIKPAGWVLILAALGGGLYWSYTKIAPFLAEREEHAHNQPPIATKEPPSDSARPEPAAPAEPPKAPDVLSKSLFPSAIPALPAPGALPKVALPPLVLGITASGPSLQQVSSEREAIHAVVAGTADAAIVSVAALAANPKAIDQSVRAIWYVGSSRASGALVPTCDPAELRKLNLGVVRLSLAHFNLLAQLAGSALPNIVEFNTEAELEEAWSSKLINGGEAFRDRTDAPCGALPDSAFSLVVIGRNHGLTPAQLSAVVSLRRPSAPDADAVASFFQTKFPQLFDSAGKVWLATKHINEPASAAAAVDPSFVASPEPPAVAKPGPTQKPIAPVEAPAAPVAASAPVAWGQHSWVDR